jgi:hypothetical protein
MNEAFRKEVDEKELEYILRSFQKGKSPGPDGFTIEFYLGFFEFLKEDLIKVVRESQRSGKVLGALNSTFIALIPKKQDSGAFEDFRSISCCNLIYKLISKIIAQRLKPILNEIIFEEQFGFLFKRQIHDAVSLAQETLHTVHRQKQAAFAVKLDLSKAYDRVNWTFLRLLLIQIGFEVEAVEWIMGCIQSSSFAVLINGSPSPFFRPSRGLRQGCQGGGEPRKSVCYALCFDLMCLPLLWLSALIYLDRSTYALCFIRCVWIVDLIYMKMLSVDLLYLIYFTVAKC